jgi:hypothetical protein
LKQEKGKANYRKKITPAETGEDGRQFVAALERQTNLFDGRELQLGLALEMMAHGGEQRRMLPVQTPEPQ